MEYTRKGENAYVHKELIFCQFYGLGVFNRMSESFINFSNFPVLVSMPVFATLCHVCAVAKIFLCLVCDLQKEDEGRGRSIK